MTKHENSQYHAYSTAPLAEDFRCFRDVGRTSPLYQKIPCEEKVDVARLLDVIRISTVPGCSPEFINLGIVDSWDLQRTEISDEFIYTLKYNSKDLPNNDMPFFSLQFPETDCTFKVLLMKRALVLKRF